jgi:hypothetical protein
MQAYRVETTVQQDGSLIVRNLPLQAGESVEVIVLIRPPTAALHNPYPFRGIPITYRDPFAPVAESDWESA